MVERQGEDLERAVKVKSKVKKDLRDCGGRRKEAEDGELTPGQGLNLRGAYQRRDRLTVSCWDWGGGNVNRSRGIMHHLSDTRPVRSRHGTGDTGINDYPNLLG